MFTPSYMSLDYETALLSGEPSVEAYRDDFRVVSCAFAWRQEDGSIKKVVTWGETDTEKMLEKIQRTQVPVVIHNLAFEMLVTKCRFPSIDPMGWTCTMRLTQMKDNGGSSAWIQKQDVTTRLTQLEGYAPQNGFSLEAAASRFLGRQYYKHKHPYYEKIIARGGKKKDLNLLTPEELVEYNALDAEVTLVLYETLTKQLAELGVDWTKDHKLFRYRCHLTTGSRIRGVRVDLSQVDRCIETKTKELAEIEEKFLLAFKSQIAEIEAEMAETYINVPKTEKGRQNRREELERAPIKFNINSSDQKRRLFVDKLGLEPRFFTDKGAATLGAKLLWQFGESGKFLEKLGTVRISLQQTETLKKLAEYDGRYHVDVKVVGTRSSRMSGGGAE